MATPYYGFDCENLMRLQLCIVLSVYIHVLSIVPSITHVHDAQHMYTQFVHSLRNLNQSHHT